MADRATADAELAPRRVFPDLPCFVSTDEQVRKAVQAGIADYEAGPTYDLAAVETELQAIIRDQR